MNYKVAVIGIVIIAILVLMFVFMKSSISSKKEEFEQTKQELERELQKVKERHQEAQDIIQQKFNAGAKWDSRFADYDYSDEDVESEEQTKKGDGKIIGFAFPYSGSFEGITVFIIGEDGYYARTTDSTGQYSISAPPGKYNLVINHPGHKNFEKQITIESGRTILENQIRLEKL